VLRLSSARCGFRSAVWSVALRSRRCWSAVTYRFGVTAHGDHATAGNVAAPSTAPPGALRSAGRPNPGPPRHLRRGTLLVSSGRSDRSFRADHPAAGHKSLAMPDSASRVARSPWSATRSDVVRCRGLVSRCGPACVRPTAADLHDQISEPVDHDSELKTLIRDSTWGGCYVYVTNRTAATRQATPSARTLWSRRERRTPPDPAEHVVKAGSEPPIH